VLADGRLASAGFLGNIKLWPKDGTGEPMVLTHGGPVMSLAVLADGRLASGGFDGEIRVWPKEGTGEPTVLMQGGRVTSLAVLTDGRLASAGLDGKVRLWLVDEQKLIAALCLRAGRNLTKDEWAGYIGPDTPQQPSCRAFGLRSNWRTPD
jgi:WD40 repeat protein